MTRLLSAMLFALMIAALMQAQPADGPYWTTIPIPAGFQSVSLSGGYAKIRNVTDVTFYSAFRRSFTIVPASASATIVTGEDYCIVKDGTSITAYSAERAAISTITVPATGVLTTGAAGSCAVVIDGAQAWGYAASLGAWAPITLASGSATHLVVADRCVLMQDATQIHALSAVTGSWTSFTPSEPIQNLDGDGSTGLAWGATTTFVYSAHRQHWASLAYVFAGSSYLVYGNGFVAHKMGNHLFYSAMTETFATSGAGSLSSASSVGTDGIWVSDQSAFAFFPFAMGTLVTVPQTFVPMTGSQGWAAIIEPNAVRAFSFLKSAWATPLSGTFSLGAFNNDVVVTNGPVPYVYSAILNTWTLAPSNGPVSSTSALGSSVVRARSNGYDAFSARTGTWSSIAVPLGSLIAPTSSLNFCAYDATTLNVFDSRLGRWTSATTAAQPTVFGMGNTVVAFDGATAYGFASTNDQWDTLSLPSPPLAGGAARSIGYVRSQTHLHFYAAPGSLWTRHQVPEAGRHLVRGTSLPLTQLGTPGSIVTAAIAWGSAFVPTPPYGTVFLDLNQLYGFVDLGTIAPSGALEVSLPVPDLPWLSGVGFHLQDIVYPPAAPTYITNSVAPIIL